MNIESEKLKTENNFLKNINNNLFKMMFKNTNLMNYKKQKMKQNN